MKRLLLMASPEEIRLAVEEDGVLADYLAERMDREDLVGRIYRGIVKNTVPAVKGCFIDLGTGKNGFLREEDALPGRRLTEGSTVLVQIVKDSTATKGPLVTEKISLAGRYSVLLREKGYIGISRKIRSEAARGHFRKLAKSLCPEGMGLIVRTAAGDAPEEEVEADLRRLAGTWSVIEKRSRVGRGAALLFRRGDLAVRACREFLDDSVGAVITNEEESLARMEGLLREEAPEKARLLRLEKGPLFARYHVEEQIAGLFERQVPLPSGGSLVIDYTEALTAVDVNSGSFRAAGVPHDEAAFLVNREAAVVLMRQLRMRGVGGMILVDFIDMASEEQKEALLAVLRKEAARDRVKTAVLGMTRLGLVEMTRKRTAHRLEQNYYETCPLCRGRGSVLSPSSVVLRIHEALEAARRAGTLPGAVVVECSPDAAALLETEEEQFRLAAITLRPVRIESCPDMRPGVFSVLADHSVL